MRYSKPYHDACKMQALIMTNTTTMPAKELANASKAYVALEMLKLRIRMKPAPKPVDTLKLERNVHQGSQGTFTED